MAFHPYPQLIRKLFNVYRCGPPECVTTPSAWPWVDHQVSRQQQPTTTPCSDSLSLRLRTSTYLTSPVTVTRRLIMQKARRHPPSGRLRPLVSVWFQGLFHPGTPRPFHRSLTVLSTIGLLVVFSLGRWYCRIQRKFHWLPPTQDTQPQSTPAEKGLSPAAVGFPKPLSFSLDWFIQVL